MFEFNATQIIEYLQSVDYRSIVIDLFKNTYLGLFLFTLSIMVYIVFVGFFYKHVSKRDLFKLDLSKYSIEESKWNFFKKAWFLLLHVFKYGVVFPLYVGFWFVIFSLILFIISKDVHIDRILSTSVVFVSVIRIMAYLDEGLSKDLAKLLPFALLAVFIISPTEFSIDVFLSRVWQVPSLAVDVLKFLSFSILLEWVIRILYTAVTKIKSWFE